MDDAVHVEEHGHFQSEGPVGSSQFGDMLKCKDNITKDFINYNLMFPSALIRPRAGHLNQFLRRCLSPIIVFIL